jgi:tetratricopeptide (TPR) repeat protein
VLIIVVMPVMGTLWYYFTIYRGAGSTTRGFELPGASHRKRIKELQAQIHHLDKPHHHSQLGDVYFQMGKLAQAEVSYRAAMERDPQDIDTRAHFAQCLLRQKKPKEALPLLQGVVNENPKHDYGHSLMALAETHMALGETDTAIAYWQKVTENHNYARARVQLGELLAATGKTEPALAEVREVLNDEPHAPAFQRKRDRVWVRRARKLLRQLS